MNSKVFITILCIFFAFVLKAQEESDCSKTLKKAQQVYDAGEIENVEAMLFGCLEEGFNRAQKTEALKLIVLANLFDDNLVAADSNMAKLLKVNPDFKPISIDHQEIKNLYSKFRTDPLLIIDFMAGLNLSYGYVLADYDVDHFNPSQSEYYSKTGVNGGFIAHYLLKNLWRVNAGFFYKTKEYGILNKYNREPNLAVEDTKDQTIDATVSIASIDIPFGITKEFGRKKLTPHVGVGGSFSTYFNSTHTIQREYSDAAFAPEPETKVNTRAQSSLLNISAIANAGVRYKLGLTGKLIFDVRLGVGMMNQSRVNNRYENSQLIFQYYFLPDDFLLHNLSFNIGYSQLLYKPKKIRD